MPANLRPVNQASAIPSRNHAGTPKDDHSSAYFASTTARHDTQPMSAATFGTAPQSGTRARMFAAPNNLPDEVKQAQLEAKQRSENLNLACRNFTKIAEDPAYTHLLNPSEAAKLAALKAQNSSLTSEGAALFAYLQVLRLAIIWYICLMLIKVRQIVVRA